MVFCLHSVWLFDHVIGWIEMISPWPHLSLMFLWPSCWWVISVSLQVVPQADIRTNDKDERDLPNVAVAPPPMAPASWWKKILPVVVASFLFPVMVFSLLLPGAACCNVGVALMHDLWDIIMLLIRAISWLIRTKVASYIYIYIYIWLWARQYPWQPLGFWQISWLFVLDSWFSRLERKVDILWLDRDCF